MFLPLSSSDVKFFDAGDYLCNATNKFGWESKSGSLIVKEHTRFEFWRSGANVIKPFTAVIYCHSMVILSFCVINQYYLGNYNGIAVNYHGICVTNVMKHNVTQNGSKIMQYFNPKKLRLKILR